MVVSKDIVENLSLIKLLTNMWNMLLQQNEQITLEELSKLVKKKYKDFDIIHVSWATFLEIIIKHEKELDTNIFLRLDMEKQLINKKN